MRKLLWAGVLFFAISCGCGENSNTSTKSEKPADKGNSAGSNTIEMDTLHMDTSSQDILKDSAQ